MGNMSVEKQGKPAKSVEQNSAMNKVNVKVRHFRLRKRLAGTEASPRLAVFRSAKHIYAQVIDDTLGKTLAAASDLKLGKKGQTKVDIAFAVGKKLAADALKKGINQVVFDRGGFAYHGRVEKLARGAREGGLKF